MSHTAICKRTIEAFDGTTIKKGEQVEVTYGLGYDPKDGMVSKIQAGRKYITGVNVNDLEFVKEKHYSYESTNSKKDI